MGGCVGVYVYIGKFLDNLLVSLVYIYIHIHIFINIYV